MNIILNFGGRGGGGGGVGNFFVVVFFGIELRFMVLVIVGCLSFVELLFIWFFLVFIERIGLLFIDEGFFGF